MKESKVFTIIFILLSISVIAIPISVGIAVETRSRDSEKITLYTSDHKEIKRWVSKGSVKFDNGFCVFYDKYSESDKPVKISGTIIVE